MSDPHHAGEFLARIFAFMLRAANDPAIINRTSREMGTIVTAWRILRVMAPGLLPFGAEQFQRSLLTKGARATADAIISWAQSPPADVTSLEFAAYQNRLLDQYNAMMNMRAMANSREMQKSLIDNMVR
jgi:hypothetical protein